MQKKNTGTYLSLQTKIFLLVFSIVTVSLFTGTTIANKSVSLHIEKDMAEYIQNVAHMVAGDETVRKAFSQPNPAGIIQPYVERIRQTMRVEFITVFDMQGIRYSHPVPEQIGLHMVGGDEGPVLEGKEYISKGVGTLGPSLRAFMPIYDMNGTQVGALKAGILLSSVDEAEKKINLVIIKSSIVGLILGMLGAYFLSRNIKRSLLGLEPKEIATLFEQHSAMLESIREGIIAVDQNNKIVVINNQARQILNIEEQNIINKPVEEVFPSTILPKVLSTGIAQYDHEHSINNVAVLTNGVPVLLNNEIVGAIATFRDISEISKLGEELTGVRMYAETLRAQKHEFMNTLHVISGLLSLESYQEAQTYISQVSQTHQDKVKYVIERISEPAIAGLIIGKFSRAQEKGAELILKDTSCLSKDALPFIHESITILGNLIDNGIEAVEASTVLCKRIHIKIRETKLSVFFEIEDTGPSMDTDVLDKIFVKGYTTKPGNQGLGLYIVKEMVTRLGGKIKIISKPGIGTIVSVVLPRGGD